MMSLALAEEFARDRVEAWNAHDFPRLLAHYVDDFEMNSPFIARFANELSGKLKGKARVAAYWQSALEQKPDLKFELLDVLAGASSVVVFYRTNLWRKVAEVFFFNDRDLVERAAAHYQSD